MTADEWFPAEIRIPKGTHLSNSQATPGVNSALIFGKDGTRGPAQVRLTATGKNAPAISNLLPSDASKYMTVAAVALAVGVVTTVVVIEHGPKIKAWWNEKALPRLVSGLAWLADIDLAEFVDPTTKDAAIGPVPTAEFSAEVGVVVQDLREDMSNEEARRRLLLVYMAASIISEQMRKLNNARIADADFEALQAAMNKLTTGQVVDDLNTILQSDTSILDEDTQAMFVKVFGGGHLVDGTFKPVSLDDVESALRLPGTDGAGTETGEDDDGDGEAPALV